MADTVRCWLAERTYDDRNLVTLAYATPDGERVLRQECSANLLSRGGGVTAAVDVDPDRLAPVADETTRERYAAEVERVSAERAPDETV